MIFPCDTCLNRQHILDPQGCFMEVSTTGFWGRLMRMLFGCERYRRNTE